jgi:hypothetical protein
MKGKTAATRVRFSRVLLFIFSALIVGTGLYAEEIELVDFGRTSRKDWKIEADGFASEAAGNLGYGVSERGESMMTLELDYAPGFLPSYYVLVPHRDYSIPRKARLISLRLKVQSYEYGMKTAAKFEDKKGRQFEFYLGELSFSGWRTLQFSIPRSGFSHQPFDGLIFKGLVFYVDNPNSLFPSTRRIDLQTLLVRME